MKVKYKESKFRIVNLYANLYQKKKQSRMTRVLPNAAQSQGCMLPEISLLKPRLKIRLVRYNFKS